MKKICEAGYLLLAGWLFLSASFSWAADDVRPSGQDDQIIKVSVRDRDFEMKDISSEGGDSSSPLAGEASSKIYTVAQVIDGETILLNGGQRVKLIGVDAPPVFPEDLDFSLYFPSAAEYEALAAWGVDIGTLARLGRESRRFVQELIHSEQSVRVVFSDVAKKDEGDGRPAFIYIQKGSALVVKEFLLNNAVIVNGYGMAEAIPGDQELEDQFRANAEQARQQRRGLWNQ